MSDPDAHIRIAAFQHLSAARRAQGGALPWSLLRQGFSARGQHFGLATQAEGIYRPKGMSGLLSVKTVVPREGREVWYRDQVGLGQLSQGDTFSYDFKGPDPSSAQNQWLRDAMERHLPIIYFYGVAEALYEPLFPAFVTEWTPAHLRCSLVVSSVAADDVIMPQPHERRYAMHLVHLRLRQSVFRERVLEAYGHRCALSGLPEPRLIDAAHIIPDRHDAESADVRNGICMSKIHRAAYDTDLIGIDPDLRIHVSERLLELHDGPLLEDAIKGLAGKTISVPSDELAMPDRDRLALRFEQFRAGR